MWGASNFTYTFFVVGWDRELSHQGSNCESWSLLFQVSRLGLRWKSYNKSKWRFDFHLKWLCWTLNLEWFNPVVTHMFLVSALNYKTCHIPLKCWCPIKKSHHIKPTWCLERNVVHFLNRPLQLPNVQTATRNFRWAAIFLSFLYIDILTMVSPKWTSRDGRL